MIRLVAHDLQKSYGPTRALVGLDLDLCSGEIVGLAGPNGAGKSTLTRMLAGEERPDSGRIVLERDGVAVSAVEHHVAVVHQEPQVWPNLTVIENLAVGHEQSAVGRIRPSRDPAAALRLLDLDAIADFQLSDLSLAVQQRVEIARAILYEADVFLFDEPNSALTEDESEAMFATMRRLAESGKIVLLITHRLNDFVRCCNRVLVLRDGRIQADLVGSVTEEAIVAELTKGLTAAEGSSNQQRQTLAREHAEQGIVLTDFQDAADVYAKTDLVLHPGKVVAVSGVEGSGARELVQGIGRSRATRPGSSAVRADGRPFTVQYVAASRRSTVFPNLSVGENLVVRLGAHAVSRPYPILSGMRIRLRAEKAVRQYLIKAASIHDSITSLSGGNQQKVVVSAAVEADSDLLVIEEPTRGVDFSSRQDIYRILRDYALSGRCVLLFCTEPTEMHEAADELLVMAKGRIEARLDLASVPDVAALTQEIGRIESVVHRSD